MGVLWESYRPTSSNHRRKRIYPLSYSFLSSLPFSLLLLQCFISFRQSAKGYKVFTFHTISTRVERDEKKDSLTLPSFWNKKKKTTSTIFFFLPSFIHLVRYRMNGSGTINTHGPYFSTSASSISLFPSCAIT